MSKIKSRKLSRIRRQQGKKIKLQEPNNQLQARHTAGIPIVFIKKPEPTESIIASTTPSPVASAKEVDTEGSSSLPSGQPNNIVNGSNEPSQMNIKGKPRTEKNVLKYTDGNCRRKVYPG